MRKTLIILSPGFPASEADTNCLPAIQQFVRHFKSAHPLLDVVILAVAYPHTTEPYTWHGCRVIPLRGNRFRKLLRPLLWLRIRKTLTAINNQPKPAGLLSFWCGEWAVVASRFAEKHRIPHYCWLQGQDTRPGNRYARMLKHRPQELIALSDTLAATFHAHYGATPARTLPFGTEAVTLSGKARTIDLLGAGSLIPLKAWDVFLHVVHRLKKEIPALKAVLCGDGPLLAELQQTIVQLQLQANVTLAGELPHAELLQLMQETKILLHPSSFEGFSTVCTEALQAGCHVISHCRAMNQEIEQWHIAVTPDAMYLQARKLLLQADTEYRQGIPFSIETSIHIISSLFQCSDSNAS